MPDLLDRLNAAMAGRYAVDAAVGRGGMATVFRARDLKHGRPVAIKVLHPDLADSVGHERFLREIEILAGLNHPNILGLIDSGEADGLLYYVMPFVDGESLRDRLQREGQLPIEDAVGITREVADALGFAHRQGFVHRDVKPGNIMFLAGHAVVTDFGIARAVSEAGGDQLTRTGLSIGTPHYMSPEQATGAETLDGRSDLYSLGCVLYEMVGGEPPYSGSTSAAILARHSQAEIPSVEIIRPQTPPQVTQVIERALAKSPADRYRTAQQLREELSGDVAVSARKAAKRTDRSWGRAALISASVLVLAAAAWAASQARSRSAPGSPLPLLRSVAVLSFADLTPGGDLAHLGEGIAEELRYVLAGLPDLKVAGRTSSIRLSHRDLGYAELGDQLGVDAIIDGTVRRDEDRIRVKLEALRASDGSPLWSEAFEGDLAGEGVFDLQEQIAEMAVKALLPELKGVSIPTSRNRTSDSEVYDHYIRGEHLMYMLTRAGVLASIEQFSAAIELDSMYAPAWAGLAVASDMAGRYEFLDSEQAFEQQRVAAERAIQLDDDRWEAHYAIGLMYRREGDRAAARSALRTAMQLAPTSVYPAAALSTFEPPEVADSLLDRARAIDPMNYIVWNATFTTLARSGDLEGQLEHARTMAKLFPERPEAAFQLGIALRRNGFIHEAIEAGRSAAILDPQSIIFRDWLTYWLYLARDYEGSIGEARIVEELFPGYGLADLARAFAETGRFEEALSSLDTLDERLGRNPEAVQFPALRAYVLAAADRPTEARTILAELQALDEASRWNSFATDMAFVLAALGDIDAAFDWLQSDPPGLDLVYDPRLDPLRPDPRFDALIRRQGLEKIAANAASEAKTPG